MRDDNEPIFAVQNADGSVTRTDTLNAQQLQAFAVGMGGSAADADRAVADVARTLAALNAKRSGGGTR